MRGGRRENERGRVQERGMEDEIESEEEECKREREEEECKREGG